MPAWRPEIRRPLIACGIPKLPSVPPSYLPRSPLLVTPSLSLTYTPPPTFASIGPKSLHEASPSTALASLVRYALVCRASADCAPTSDHFRRSVRLLEPLCGHVQRPYTRQPRLTKRVPDVDKVPHSASSIVQSFSSYQRRPRFTPVSIR